MIVVSILSALWCKSFIQFSVDGWGCVPSLLFDLRPNYSGGNEDKGDLLQNVPCMHCYTQCPHRCSRPPPTQTSTGVSWILTGKSTSNLHLFWGHCSFFLGPGEHKILFVPSKNLYSQSYVSSGNSMVGLMAISSKRAYAIPRSAVPRLPVPAAVYCWPIPPQETLKHRSTLKFKKTQTQNTQTQALWGLWVLVQTRFVWVLWASLACMGFHSKCDFTPRTIFLGFLLCPWKWGISSKSLQHHADAAPVPAGDVLIVFFVSFFFFSPGVMEHWRIWWKQVELLCKIIHRCKILQ